MSAPTTCELHGWDRSRSQFDRCPTCVYRERQARGEDDFEDLAAYRVSELMSDLSKLGVPVVRFGDPSTYPCPFCGKTGPHSSGPDDKFHHVVYREGEPWPE